MGVQLNLANPEDPIDVKVLVDGTLHPANEVVRNGSFLYIMGLQAGTEYSLNVTLSNIFGTAWVNTTVRPLLGELVESKVVSCPSLPHYPSPSSSGRPSTPQVTLVPTAGGLTVQLTAMYPGTREDTIQYSISTSASPRSRRQTGHQTLPVTDLTTPVSGSAEVALGPGTYSVTVTVTNQHGSTTSEPQQVTIPGWHVTALCHIQLCMCVHTYICVYVLVFVFAEDSTDNRLVLSINLYLFLPPPPGPVSLDTAVIIGVVVAVVVMILAILSVFFIVLVCVKYKSTSESKKSQGRHVQYVYRPWPTG